MTQSAALDRIRGMSAATLTPADVAPVLGCDPNTIRQQAREDPGALGFPVVLVGSRTKIPREPFLRYVDQTRPPAPAPEDEPPVDAAELRDILSDQIRGAGEMCRRIRAAGDAGSAERFAALMSATAQAAMALSRIDEARQCAMPISIDGHIPKGLLPDSH